MKKILLFSLLLIVINTTAYGQILVGGYFGYKHRVRLGIKSGFNLATFTGPDDDFNSGFSSSSVAEGKSLAQVFTSGAGIFPNLGMTSQIEIHKNFSIQPELFFQQTGTQYEGGKIDFQGSLLDVSAKISINYMTLNALGRFSIGNEQTRFILLMGPYVSYAFYASESLTVNYGSMNSQSESSSIPIRSGRLSSSDLGGTVGLGVALKSGTADVIIDLRYSRGFEDHAVNKGIIFSSASKASYNSVISLNFSYLFCLNCVKNY